MFLESLFLYVWMECPKGVYIPKRGKAELLQRNWKSILYLFDEAQFVDEDTPPKLDERMKELAELLESLDDFSLAHQEEVVMKWIEDKGYHLGNIMNAFRLTLVGEGKGPHMFDISAVLGKEETVTRMRRAVESL